MASISSPGIGSGLDVAGIVSQLVAAERAPTQVRLDRREAEALAKLSALGTVRAALSSFQSALQPLTTLEGFQGRTTRSGNDAVFTALADSTAVPGRYSVEVTTLASGAKLRSAAYASADTVVGSGTLTITSNSQVFTVNIDSPNDTLVDIAAAINDSAFNTEVLATIVNSVDGAHLVLSSAATGAASAITVQASGDPGLDALVYDPGAGVTNMVEVDAPADASLLIDGLTVTSTSNSVVDAIDGVTIDLLGAEPGNSYELNIAVDTDGARERVTVFVDAYNELLTTLAGQTTFDVDTLVAGPLFGESAVRNLVFDLRSQVGGVINDTSSPYRALSEIGISTNLDGTLALDEAALNDAFAAGLDDVGRLFSDDTGFANQLDEMINAFLEPDAALTVRTDGLELLIDDIADQREALDLRMDAVRVRLTAQFNALDSLISQLDSTSTFIAQQFANLPGSSPLRGNG